MRALVSLSKKLLRLQNIKGRYFGGDDIMLEKHLEKMGFVEFESTGEDDAGTDPEEGEF